MSSEDLQKKLDNMKIREICYNCWQDYFAKTNIMWSKEQFIRCNNGGCTACLPQQKKQCLYEFELSLLGAKESKTHRVDINAFSHLTDNSKRWRGLYNRRLLAIRRIR